MMVDWGVLPYDILDNVKTILKQQLGATSLVVRSLRLVNRHWSRWATVSAEHLTLAMGAPLQELVDALVGKFIGVKALGFSFRCGEFGGMAQKDLALLARLPRLTWLDVGGCDVTDSDMDSLGRMTNLMHLDLSWCRRMTDSGVAHLAMLPSLSHLNLKGCALVTSKGLRHIAGPKLLTHLGLRSCRVSDDGMMHVGALTALTCLELDCSRLTDEGLGQLGKLSRLKHLSLWGEGCCGGSGLKWAEGLQGLKHLDLHGCQGVTNRGLECVGKLLALRFLDVRNCRHVTGAGIGRLPKSLCIAGPKSTDWRRNEIGMDDSDLEEYYEDNSRACHLHY
eukprot:evm.model.scf_1704.4 EVM.evm.TU.scf_1704.4   scf_1704:34218-35225(+)